MEQSYRGNAKPYAFTLYHKADQGAVQPVLDALSQKGLRLCYGEAATKSAVKRASALIAFASGNSVVDNAFESAILLGKAEGVPVICVDLDGTPLPDSLAQALFSSNTISANRYGTGGVLAARIMTAESLNPPKLTKAQLAATRRLALTLILGAFAIVAAIATTILPRLFGASQVAAIEALPDVAGLVESGMTEEDLLAVKELYLVGDTRVDFTESGDEDSNWHDVVLDVNDGSGTVWIVEEERIPRGTITDISLIGRMTNLETLVLCNQSLTDLTPLSNLTKLRHIEILDMPLTDISPLGNIASLEQIDLLDVNVSDLSPLNACEKLRRFTCSELPLKSLDGLGHGSLRELEIFAGSDMLTDISALAACTELKELFIKDAHGLVDISPLAACTALSKLDLRRCDRLRNLSPLSTLDSLTELYLYDVPVSDLSCFRNSKGLTTIDFQDIPVQDLSWTAGMKSLQFMKLHCELTDLNFLKDMAVQQLELHFSGPITDYSGLAAIPSYSYIHVNPHNHNVSAVLPYLQNAKIGDLCLYDCNGLDLTMLPQVNSIEIYYSDLHNLAGLDRQQNLHRLRLRNMNYLTSLNGLPTNGQLQELEITDCLRLTDISPMYGQSLASIRLTGLLITPDFSQIQFRPGGERELYLDNVAGITDVSFLPDVKGVTKLDVRALDTLADLSPIESSSVRYAILPPQVAEQAAALVENDVLHGYEIAYPEGEKWEDSIQAFSLVSLDELDTLPEVLLSHVADINLVGDHLCAAGEEHWQFDWNRKKLLVRKNNSDEAPVAVGAGGVDSLDRFQALTGLNQLSLVGQPLTSLSGVETFTNLRRLDLSYSTALSDASNAFTLTELEELLLSNTAVTSIQGVQNLSKLRQLDLSDTGVADLNPLDQWDFSYATENGGFSLIYNNPDCKDFSALEGIPRFRLLSLSGADAGKWLPFIAGKPMSTLYASGTQLTNEQVAVLAALPELRELSISWNEQVSDLTPLLSCQTLAKLTVSSNMREALESIVSRTAFEINIEG